MPGSEKRRRQMVAARARGREGVSQVSGKYMGEPGVRRLKKLIL